MMGDSDGESGCEIAAQNKPTQVKIERDGERRRGCSDVVICQQSKASLVCCKTSERADGALWRENKLRKVLNRVEFFRVGAKTRLSGEGVWLERPSARLSRVFLAD